MNIGIFATGDMTPKGEQRKYEFLKNNGFNVFEHSICKKVHNGYLAGTAKERADALHELYQDDTIDIVMSFWGGFNTNEVLKHLDYELIKNNFKPTIGFSDTTALLIAITQKTGQITYLGPAGITYLKPEPLEYTLEYMKKAVSGESEILISDSEVYADDAYYLKKPPENLVREIKKNKGRLVVGTGIATGKIIAGNLQTILILAGTEYFPELEGSIIFIEEDETITNTMFRRFLTQLSLQKNFSKIKGLVFGRFAESANIDDEQLIDLINEICGDLNIPILYNLDFGHTDPMFTIPIGGIAHINTSKNILIFNQ